MNIFVTEYKLKCCSKAGIRVQAKENGGNGGKTVFKENRVKNVPKLSKWFLRWKQLWVQSKR